MLMKNLKKEMKLKGMTHADLASTIGVSVMTIHGWIAGIFKPSPKSVKKLLDMGFSEDACLRPADESKED
jgi:transcriptional regulator with XRE-family HTH domain